MDRNLKVKQVFTPGGFPSITYVSREYLNLEKRLEDALARGHGIITVTGPTKSGKTVLCRKVLQSEKSVWIEGGRIREERDFWDQITGSDYAPPNVTQISTLSTTADAKTGLSGEISFPGFGKVGGNIGGGGSTGATESFQRSFSADQKSRTLKYLLSQEISLVIDDFHFVSREIQTIIINSLKSSILMA